MRLGSVFTLPWLSWQEASASQPQTPVGQASTSFIFFHLLSVWANWETANFQRIKDPKKCSFNFEEIGESSFTMFYSYLLYPTLVHGSPNLRAFGKMGRPCSKIVRNDSLNNVLANLNSIISEKSQQVMIRSYFHNQTQNTILAGQNPCDRWSLHASAERLLLHLQDQNQSNWPLFCILFVGM